MGSKTVYSVCALIWYLINAIYQHYKRLRYRHDPGINCIVLIYVLNDKSFVIWFHVAAM